MPGSGPFVQAQSPEQMHRAYIPTAGPAFSSALHMASSSSLKSSCLAILFQFLFIFFIAFIIILNTNELIRLFLAESILPIQQLFQLQFNNCKIIRAEAMCSLDHGSLIPRNVSGICRHLNTCCVDGLIYVPLLSA